MRTCRSAPRRDVWQDLAAIKCPTMIVRGLRSDRYTPEILARIARDYPQIEWATANSQHDVADQAPQELVAAIRKFSRRRLTDHVDCGEDR